MSCYEFLNTKTFYILSSDIVIYILYRCSNIRLNEGINEIIELVLLTIPCVIIAPKNFQKLWFIYKLFSDSDRIFLYPIDFKKERKTYFLKIIFYTLVICLLYVLNRVADFFFIIFILFLIIISNILIPFHNKNDILESHQLNIGYGAALSYYKNYLDLFVPYHLKERIETFKTFHQVDVVNKLFILVPKSCKVQRYIQEPEIERCQELPPLIIPMGGIKDRVYNITVYLIKTDEIGRGKRMAIEYAQPLKGLFSLKEKKLITEEEMYYQRELFSRELQNFLRDTDDSYKFCELVDYDDQKQKVSEALLEKFYMNCHSKDV